MEVVYSNVTLARNWGFYLMSPDLSGEEELRNKIGVLWICGLIDTFDGGLRAITRTLEEADAVYEASLIHNAKELQKVLSIISSVVSVYSREEQIFLDDVRNQLVHSYLSGRHHDMKRVRYVENGVFSRENLPIEKYQEVIRGIYEQGGLDSTLSKLLSKSLDSAGPYWRMIEKLHKDFDNINGLVLAGACVSLNL